MLGIFFSICAACNPILCVMQLIRLFFSLPDGCAHPAVSIYRGVIMSLGNLPRFIKLLKSQYLNIEVYDENAFYFCIDTQELFIGSRAITSSSMPAAVLFTPSTQYATINQLLQVSGIEMSITWYDPADFTTDWANIRTWSKTVLIKNDNHYPTSPTDGTVIVENSVPNAYSNTPVPIYMPSGATYIALYTQNRSGVWSDYENTPKRELVAINVETLDEYMTALRSGEVRGLKMLYPVGSTLPWVDHSFFTTMSWAVGAYDYKDNKSSVSEYCCNDPSVEHNVILVPTIAPSLSNGAQLHTPYDLIEKTSALSVDTAFDSGKTYYTNSACTTVYDQNNAQQGDTPVSLGLYEKGRVTTSNGYGRYKESFLRRWLNSIGSNWYTPLNIFEPASYAFSDTYDGFLGGFSAKVRSYMHRVSQSYRIYTGNNNYDTIEDLVWLPTDLQLFPATNGSTERMLDIYKNATSSEMIFYSYNHTAVYAYTGSQGTGQSNNPSHLVNLSTEGVKGTAGKLQGGGQGKDTSMPMFCLA